MKRIFAVIVTIVLTITAMADNRIYIEDAKQNIGQELTLPVYLSNTDEITAFQFDVTLPEGCTLGADAFSMSNSVYASHYLTHREISQNVYRVICYAPDNLRTFLSNKEALVFINIAPIMLSGNYTISISNIEMTGPNLEKYTCSDSEATVTVENYAEGEFGTCVWYIDAEGTLIIAPKDGVNGELPGSLATTDGMSMTPWHEYRDNIVAAKVMPGVKASISCNNMFFGLEKMVSIDLSGLNTDNTTEMGFMFYGCTSLESIDLSSLNTQNVTYMSYMFNHCSSLTSLDVSSLNTENVTFMNSMFNDCSSLTTLDLSNFTTQNTTEMMSLFDYSNNISTIISNNATPSLLKAGTFETFENRTNCTLIVPVGTKELYEAADGWNELGKIDDSLPNDGSAIPEDAIASGEEGTCIWYITSEKELVITPANGVSGDLPEEGWSYQSDDNYNNFTSAPWGEYFQDVFAVKILSGVNAYSCAYMFLGMKSIATVELSGLNTQNVTDMKGMFCDCSSLTSLDLSGFNTQNLTNMSYMFDECSSLTTLDLSNFNTENVTVMSYMFDNCRSLTSLELSNFNTQNVTDMRAMFAGCSSLASLDLSNFNTQKVEYMSDMFSGCSSLTSLDLSNFNTQNVTDMSGMFSYCSSLTSLDLSNFNTQNVTIMSDMFYGCSSLTSIDLSNFNTMNVTNMESMFHGCSSLTSLDLSNFNTQNVTDMEGMFYVCSSLTSLDLSNFNTQNVTDMYEMFHGCSSLTSLDLSNFNTQNVTEMYGMFYDCSSLTSLDLSNFNTQNLMDMRDMFDGCSSLTTIISDCESPSPLKVGTFGSFENRANCTLLVPAGSKALYAAADGWNELGKIDDSLPNDGSAIPEDAIASGEEGTCIWYITSENELVITPANGVSGDLPKEGWDGDWSIAEKKYITTTPWFEYTDKIFAVNVMPGVNAESCRYMFCGLEDVRNVDLSNLNTQNVTNMSYMFSDCSSLTSLNLSNFNTENVTVMSYMFDNCRSLTSLELSNFYTENVTDMRAMFAGCSSLASLDLSNFNTENVTDMYAVFSGCSSLTSLDISNFYTQNVRDMCSMFERCSSLTSLNLSNFNTQNVTDMRHMFENCSSLKSVDLSNFNTENVTNMGWMFKDCNALMSLDLSNFNTQNVENMKAMFANCSLLTSLNLSNFNTENVTDMAVMFSGCSSLTSLDLSSFNTQNVTDMELIFSKCSSLTSLDLSNFNTEKVSYMSEMFKECPALNTIISNRMTPSTLKAGTFDSFVNRTNCKLLVPEGTRALYAAADGWNELGKQGKVGTCSWYITDEGELVIAPADGVSGDLPEVGWEGYWTDEQEMFIANNPWYEYSESIFAIKIMPGVNAKSCSAMFCGLNKAKSADLNGLNTENATRMDYMFGGCSALTSLDLSNFNTQNVTDMNDMFGGCSSLTSLDLSNFDTQKVTHMGWMFWRCNSLVSLNISSFNTQNVKSTRSMFSDCISLASLDVSNFDTRNVENMDWTFRNCASLTSLDTSHFNTEKATTMWGMFAVCSSLTSLDLSSFNTQNVTNMASMFTRCSSLTSLDLSNFNTEKVTDMQWMFNMCSSLTELDLSGFNTQNVTNMSDMFTECPALNTIISNRKTPSPLKVGTFDSFAYRANCTLLVPIGSKEHYEAADGWNELGNIEEKAPDYPDAHGTLVLNLTSDEPFYNSEDYKADVVTYTRNFSKQTQKETSAGWETIVLPFDVQNMITEDGMVLAPFGNTLVQTGVALPFWLAELKDGQFVAATSIRANVPYIISMPNGDDIYSKNRISGNVIFFAHNATVYASNGTQIMQGANGFAFVPTYDFVEASDGVYAINDEVFSEGAVDYQPGSVFVHNSRTVRPFEAYMQLNQDYGFAPRFLPVMADDTDGIVTITPDTDKVSIYDLSGRKIDTMRKGVNIVIKNGKNTRVLKQ